MEKKSLDIKFISIQATKYVNKRNIRNKITVIRDNLINGDEGKKMKDEESETKEEDGKTQISSSKL